MSNLNNLKKQTGEKFANFIGRNFEITQATEKLTQYFHKLSDLRNLDEADYFKVKKILNLTEKKEEKISNKTSKEIFLEAGYILDDEITCKADYLKYKKYFQSNESLCKFTSYDATERYYKLFWITKININDIKRDNTPIKTDKYSQSCISIGISKDKTNIMQMTSRYNHSVNGCDNMFNCSLENIAEGLTESFNKDYNLKIGKTKLIELNNFAIKNNKYYFYSYEVDGIKFGNNSVDGKYYDKNTDIIFDTYRLDIKNRICYSLISKEDSLVKIINEKLENGAKINLVKTRPETNLENTITIIKI